jgi:ankyrin repeat protein
MLERIADGRTDLVFDYVAAGHPANSTDAGGVSLVQWCAYYGDVSAIKFLLANRESLASLGDSYGLNTAAFHGHWQLCQFLIENGADVNQALPDTGETPLHSALSHANRPAYDLVLRVLLANGANPNCHTKPSVETGAFMRDCRTKAETPLHRSAAFGTESAIQMLLDAGAVVDAKDMNGDSPLTWASWHGRSGAILKMLCYGPHRMSAAGVAHYSGDRGQGWGGMEASLRGKPHV